MISGQDIEVEPTLEPMSSRTVTVAVREQLVPTRDGAGARRGRAVFRAAVSQPPNATTLPRHVIWSALFR